MLLIDKCFYQDIAKNDRDYLYEFQLHNLEIIMQVPSSLSNIGKLKQVSKIFLNNIFFKVGVTPSPLIK